jgi:quinol-cytochrome oxidoreductase complex cytochrome b subunit
MFFLPFIDRSNYIISPKFNFVFEVLFLSFFANVIILGWLGAMPVEEPYLIISRLCTFFYFLFFFIVGFYSNFENNFIKKCLSQY